MKKFMDSGEYFILSAFRINKAPLETADLELADVARTLCEDAYYLSSDGSGQNAIEFLLISDNKKGHEIKHVITIRTHAPNEKDCVVRQEALIHGMLASLHQSGYEVSELTYKEYRDASRYARSNTAWCLNKSELIDHGLQGSYRSIPVIREINWRALYSAIDGSGCSLTIHVISSDYTDAERKTIIKNNMTCAQAEDGIAAGMRDATAHSARERWKYYADRLNCPAADVNIMVCSDIVNSALTVARMRQAMKNVPLKSIDIRDLLSDSPIYNLPWRVSVYTKKVLPV